MNLQNAAEKTIQNAYKDSKPQIAIEIITIISLIIGVIGIIQKCNATKKINKISEQPSIRNKMLVKRIIKKNLTKEQYRTESNNILTGLFQAGIKSTPKDIQDLIEEINNNGTITEGN